MSNNYVIRKFCNNYVILKFSPHIAVDHKPQACEGRLADYMKKRRPIGAEFQKLQNGIDELWFQRNYLACLIDVES